VDHFDESVIILDQKNAAAHSSPHFSQKPLKKAEAFYSPLSASF